MLLTLLLPLALTSRVAGRSSRHRTMQLLLCEWRRDTLGKGLWPSPGPCCLQDVMTRFEAKHSDWTTLPEKAVFQLNDTHPTIAVPELMRLLIDEKGLDWDAAWGVTKKCLAYTNHTVW